MIEVADRHRIAADVGAKWRAGAKLKRPVGTAEKHLHASSGDVGDIEVAVAIEVSENRGRRNHAAEVRLNLDGKRAVAVAYHQVYEGSIRPFRSRGNQIEFSILINVQDMNASRICTGRSGAAQRNLEGAIAISADH